MSCDQTSTVCSNSNITIGVVIAWEISSTPVPVSTPDAGNVGSSFVVSTTAPDSTTASSVVKICDTFSFTVPDSVTDSKAVSTCNILSNEAHDSVASSINVNSPLWVSDVLLASLTDTGAVIICCMVSCKAMYSKPD